MHRSHFGVLAILALLFAGLSDRVLAEPKGGKQCFTVPAITNCIDGRLNDYWNANGGLPVFGYPITPERPEANLDTGASYWTQWFQRNRFERHAENAAPYDVLLGRLGDDLLRKQGRDWRTEGSNVAQLGGTCQVFQVEPGTSRSVCGPFLEYWRSHGIQEPKLSAYDRSLQLFGLPLTGVKMETNPNGDTVLTQWFERARFEYHGDKGVLLGLLGNEARVGLPPETPVAFQVEKVGFGQSGTEIGYGFLVTNTLGRVTHPVSYAVFAYDVTNTLLTSEMLAIQVMYPDETLGVGGRLTLRPGQTVFRLEVQLTEQSAGPTKLTDLPANPFSTANVRVIQDRQTTNVTGSITHSLAQSAKQVMVNAIVFDAAGDIIGGGMLQLANLPANGSTTATVPVVMTGKAARAMLYPTWTAASAAQ